VVRDMLPKSFLQSITGMTDIEFIQLDRVQYVKVTRHMT
jgi:hypothetical protein